MKQERRTQYEEFNTLLNGKMTFLGIKIKQFLLHKI